MFYIRTADRLQRTAPWLDELDGGLDYLRSVVFDDVLDIADELEADMQRHVDTYECEWKATLDDPERLAHFIEFVNAAGRELRAGVGHRARAAGAGMSWPGIARFDSLPVDRGVAALVGEHPVAVFRLHDGEVRAIDHVDPFTGVPVLARGIVASVGRRIVVDLAAPQAAVRPAHRRVSRRPAVRRAHVAGARGRRQRDHRRGRRRARCVSVSGGVTNESKRRTPETTSKPEPPTLARVIKGPLAGYTIGVTADRRADEQMKLLTGRGAECVHGPVIKTHPVGSEDEIRSATEAVIAQRPAIAVLTTGLGVRGWLEAADAIQLGDELREALSGVDLLARGPEGNRRAGHGRVRRRLDRAPGTLRRHRRAPGGAGDRRVY